MKKNILICIINGIILLTSVSCVQTQVNTDVGDLFKITQNDSYGFIELDPVAFSFTECRTYSAYHAGERNFLLDQFKGL